MSGIKGNATIVSREASHKRYRVNFVLGPIQRPVRHVAGATAYGKADAKLEVQSADGVVIPEGDYDLFPDTGVPAQIHVRNMGMGQWVVEA